MRTTSKRTKLKKKNPEWHPVGVKQIGELKNPVIVIHPGDTNLPIDIVEEHIASTENIRVKKLGFEPALVLSKDSYHFFRNLDRRLKYDAFIRVKEALSSGELDLDDLLFR